MVFKSPHGIEELALQNPELVFDLMLWAAAETLKTIAAMPLYLGANIGCILQLQTASEMLEWHPHVHCLVSGGGLSFDGEHWVNCREGFLPRRVLAARFRRLLLQGLKTAFEVGELRFFGQLERLNESIAFERHLARAKAKDWNVYVERPLAGPEQILDYMNRHAQSVAISNDRLLEIKDGRVYFLWKDYRVSNKLVTTSLPGAEFVRRDLMHILPVGFKAIRPYGFLANSVKKIKLARCFSTFGRAHARTTQWRKTQKELSPTIRGTDRPFALHV